MRGRFHPTLVLAFLLDAIWNEVWFHPTHDTLQYSPATGLAAVWILPHPLHSLGG